MKPYYKHYRKCFVAGWWGAHVTGDPWFIYEKLNPKWDPTSRDYWEPRKVDIQFDTIDKAKAYAQKARREHLQWRKDNGYTETTEDRWFYRAYQYSTPEKLEDLPVWTPEDNVVHWLDEEDT